MIPHNATHKRRELHKTMRRAFAASAAAIITVVTATGMMTAPMTMMTAKAAEGRVYEPDEEILPEEFRNSPDISFTWADSIDEEMGDEDVSVHVSADAGSMDIALETVRQTYFTEDFGNPGVPVDSSRHVVLEEDIESFVSFEVEENLFFMTQKQLDFHFENISVEVRRTISEGGDGYIDWTTVDGRRAIHSYEDRKWGTQDSYLIVMDETVVPGLMCVLIVDFIVYYDGDIGFLERCSAQFSGILAKLMKQPFCYYGTDTGVVNEFVQEEKTVYADPGDGSTNENGGSGTETRTVIETGSTLFEGGDSGSDIGGVIGSVVGAGVIGGVGASVVSKAKKKKGKAQNRKQDQTQQEKQQEEKKQPSTYEMAVYKQFGDMLRKGEAPQRIGAKIIELRPVQGGGKQEVVRHDLTAQIRISSGDTCLKVQDGGMLGEYRQAMLEVDPKATSLPGEAQVIFTATTPNGTYTERMIFKIAGDPQIEFADMNPGDQDYIRNFILGDNAMYTVRVRLRNFDPMAAVQFDFTGTALGRGLSVIASEKEPGSEQDIYVLRIQNDSAAPEAAYMTGEAVTHVEKNDSGRRGNLTVRVSDGKLMTENTMYCDFYQDGLSATCDAVLKSGHILLDTIAKDGEGSRRGTIFDAVSLRFKLCVPDPKEGAVFVDPGDYQVEFDQMGAQEEVMDNVMQKFAFRVDPTHRSLGLYRIEPMKELPQPTGRPRYVGGHFATAVYRGQRYQLFISYEFKGFTSDPMQMDGIYREIENIQKICTLCGISNRTRALIHQQDLRKKSVRELCLIRRKIFDDFVAFEESNFKEFNDFAEEVDDWITALDVSKWLGDQAFSYLIKTKGGGPYVEAVLTPLKDMFAQHFGEILVGDWDGVTGQRLDASFFEDVLKDPTKLAIFIPSVEKLTKFALQTCENEFSALLLDSSKSYAAGKITGQSYLKMAGTFIAGYMLFCTCKHYCSGDEKVRGKVYDSIIAATKDLTIQSVKIFILSLIERKTKLNARDIGERIRPSIERAAKEITDPKKIETALQQAERIEKLANASAGLNDMEKFIVQCLTKYYSSNLFTLLGMDDTQFKEAQRKARMAGETEPGKFAFTLGKWVVVVDLYENTKVICELLWTYCLDLKKFIFGPVEPPADPIPEETGKRRHAPTNLEVW